jgi:uncharacterized repeat protein (TIGR03803 family)
LACFGSLCFFTTIFPVRTQSTDGQRVLESPPIAARPRISHIVQYATRGPNEPRRSDATKTLAILAMSLMLLPGGAAAATNETVLHSFVGGSDGSYPVAGLIADAAGNMYGTSRFGGANSAGTVFKLTQSGSTWSETVIYSFAGGNDGSSPAAALIMDKAGNLYGTTRLGGAASAGTGSPGRIRTKCISRGENREGTRSPRG